MHDVHVQYCYISFSVLFQTKSSLVWKSYTQKLRTIFQTNSSLVWKEKNWFCKTQIPNQIQIGLENFDDHCQCPENSKPNSVWFGKIIDYCQRLEPWTNSNFVKSHFRKGKHSNIHICLNLSFTCQYCQGRGWQWSSIFSKPIWIWFGICVLQNSIFSFQTKLELVWKIRRIFWVYLFQTKLDLVWKRTLNEM